jgi:hypothetical protein
MLRAALAVDGGAGPQGQAPPLRARATALRGMQRALHLSFTCPGPPGCLSAPSVFHSKASLYGVFVWVHRALNGPFRWFLARVDGGFDAVFREYDGGVGLGIALGRAPAQPWGVDFPAVVLAVHVGSVGAGRPRVVRGLAVVAVGGEFAFEKPAAEVAGMLARAEARAGRAAEGAGGVADLRLTVRALPERSSPHSVSHSNPIFIWRFCMGVAGA